MQLVRQYGHGLHLRQRHLTVYASRPWRLSAAARIVRVFQRQEGRGGALAHARAQQGPPRGAGHRRRRPGDHRLRRHL